ncbi:MAG: tetratricopeptide repeat protein [Sediminibacterium sp.]|nr:tetratricopeptide repeat protein [Sediminibacterium sp.]
MIRALNYMVLLGVFCLGTPAIAQKSAIYTDADALYKKGVDLFDRQQYVPAQKHFIDYMSMATPANTLTSVNAEYYAAASAIELFHKDGEWRMKQFIQRHPESTKLNSAWFYLGKNNFRKKKYDECIDYFQKVDQYKLDKEQLAELRFKRGYSYLEENNLAKAKADLYEIKDVDNKYAFPANYYYSHIAYKEKNYETAMTGFKRLVNDETFGSVVPYYITQISFIQGKYSQVVKDAPALLNDSNHVQKAGEINRMIGESYFNLNDYKNALTYLQKTDLAGGMNPQGNYALGYCYYKAGDYANAIKSFEKVTEQKDSLAQNAWYHIADCNVHLDDKARARNAFYSAYTIDKDKKIKEDALFSFAKLSYELDFSPFNEAVKAFSQYLKEYPNSPRKEEAYRYLINVYSTTKNYEQAIKSIEALPTIDPILKYTYQKLIYFKGVEYFNNGDNDNAEKQFRRSLSQNSDPKLNALCQFWLGEISYQRKDYTTAIEAWKKFQTTDGALSLQEYDLSNYNLGYAYFQRRDKEDYTNANVSFRKFLLTKNKYDDTKKADANVRAADCYFMNRDYAQANDYYETAIAINRVDVDYAYYQKALCSGLLKNYKEKVSDLKQIETKYPNSNYLSAALNELADTYYRDMNDAENGAVYYNRILKSYPNSSFANNALAGLGLIHYNKKQDDKAFGYFDQIVKKDPRSEESKEVLPYIRKIFEAKGDVEGMKTYFESTGNPLSNNQLENATYDAAKDAFYNRKNCDEALPKWEAYIKNYPEGKYIAEAQFNMAECAYSKGLYEKAMTGYQYTIAKPRSLYSEVAHVKASYLLYKDKKYQEALPVFQALQTIAEVPANKSAGRFGAMRCAFYLKEYETALSECQKVIATEKLTPQEQSEARYIKAKSMYETKRYDDALIELKTIIKTAKNITGAEAYYMIAKIQYIKQEYKEVEKTVNKLISYAYSNDDWNTKAMLLLADAYMARGNDADAEVILQVVIDNKPKKEYLDEANEKLAAIKSKQQSRTLAPGEVDMKVEFKENTKKEGDLFDKLYEESQKNANPPAAPSGTPTEQPK